MSLPSDFGIHYEPNSTTTNGPEKEANKFAPGVDMQVLEADVRSRFAGRVRDLQVTQSGRKLVLSGQAPSFYIKQLAQEYVCRLAVNCELTNDIEVTASEPSGPDWEP